MKNKIFFFIMALFCLILPENTIGQSPTIYKMNKKSNAKTQRFFVPNFSPKKHGFHFRNRFITKEWTQFAPAEHPIKKLRNLKDGYGLCGGMCHAAAELFVYRKDRPTQTSTPNTNSALYYYLAQSQLETFGLDLKYYNKIDDWYEMKDGKERLPKLSVTELGAVKLKLKRKQLAQITLMYYTQGEGNNWENHQVLVYGMEQTGENGTLYIYDPNFPNNDEQKVTYTIEDGKVIAEHLDRMVYGFLIVLPQMNNPYHQPAYLASLGQEEFVKGMRELKKQATEIAADLKKYYNLTSEQTARALKRAGYKADEVADALKKNFQRNAKQIATELAKVGYKAQDIVHALRDVMKQNGNQIVQHMKAAKIKATEISKGIQNELGYTPKKVVAIMKKAGFPLADIGDVIKTGLGTRSGYDAIDILKQNNYNALDIAKTLKKQYNSSFTTITRELRNRCKFDAYQTAKAIYEAYKLNAGQVADAIYNHAKFGLEDCKNAVEKIFNLSPTDVLEFF
jgi:hypothetical protein